MFNINLSVVDSKTKGYYVQVRELANMFHVHLEILLSKIQYKRKKKTPIVKHGPSHMHKYMCMCTALVCKYAHIST